ncbi:MAG: ATP-binding protein [Anaerolineae bacterium]|nr:ATP-binding protein [Anaerolineae bacterium]
MESIKETLKKIGGDISKGNTPTTSSASAGPDVCPHCGGMGFVMYDVPVGHPDFGKAYPCACQLEQRARSRTDDLRRIGGLDALRDKSFDTFLAEPAGISPSQATSLRMALRRARDFAENPQGWLLLQGTYGCGKTHLAAAVANRQLEQGHSVLFVSVPDLLDHLRATYTPTSDTTYDERFEQIRTHRLVILDDLGAESPTPWAQEKLYQIFNYRYTRHLPTVITTNADLDQLDPRIRSRLVDQHLTAGRVITAPDYRRGAGGGRSHTDISDLHLYAHMKFSTFDLRPNLPRPERENLKMVYETALAYAEGLERFYKRSRDYGVPLDDLKPPESLKSWLVFTGLYGVGKTHLAAAIGNHFEAPDHPVIFVTVPDLLDHLRATYGPDSSVRYDKRFQQIRTAPLLILDDLGTESATPWAREKLLQLINYRYIVQAPTVFTTSTPLQDLDQRILSRLRDKRRCEILGLDVPSYRGGGH